MTTILKTCVACQEKFECSGFHRRTQWCPECTRKKQARRKQASRASTKNTREAIKAGRLCQMCNERKVVNTHHIIPVSEGGTDDKENFLETCRRCHSIADKRNVFISTFIAD